MLFQSAIVTPMVLFGSRRLAEERCGLKCYLPGTPRAMYMPYPFKITQSTTKVHINFEFANAGRTIHLDYRVPRSSSTAIRQRTARIGRTVEI